MLEKTIAGFIIFLVVIAFIFAGCSESVPEITQNTLTPAPAVCMCTHIHTPTPTLEPNYGEYKDVSLISLIASPEKYDGKKIRVFGIGYVSSVRKTDRGALHFSSATSEDGSFKNALFLSFYPYTYKDLGYTDEEILKLNGMTIIVEGIFRAENKGEWSAFAGGIEEITRYQYWGKDTSISYDYVQPPLPEYTPTPTEPPYETKPIRVSDVYELTRLPNNYHDELIRIYGFVYIDTESNILYCLPEDLERSYIYCMIWLEVDYDVLETTYDEMKELNGEFVEIVGVFNANEKGPGGEYAGTIENILYYRKF